MKRRILILLSLFICFSLFGVQKNTQSKNNSKIVVTGYVVSKGNMPFTYPAIKADDGNEYYLVCTEKQKRRLLNYQGKHLRFTLIKNDEITWIYKKSKVIK